MACIPATAACLCNLPDDCCRCLHRAPDDEHNTDGQAEVDKNKDFYHKVVFPKLRPHQQVEINVNCCLCTRRLTAYYRHSAWLATGTAVERLTLQTDGAHAGAVCPRGFRLVSPPPHTHTRTHKQSAMVNSAGGAERVGCVHGPYEAARNRSLGYAGRSSLSEPSHFAMTPVMTGLTCAVTRRTVRRRRRSAPSGRRRSRL
jgi:hypothetical protein